MNTLLDFGFTKGAYGSDSGASPFYQQFLQGSGFAKPQVATAQQNINTFAGNTGLGADATQGQSTVTTKANRSPELENNIADMLNRINGVSSGLGTAATGLQNTYTDVINSLLKAGNKMGGAQSSQASTAALASGLTPLEAAGSGRTAFNDLVTQLMPLIATQRQGQANVPYQLQKDISQYAVTPYQNLLAQVQAPYQQALAGTSQVTTDPLRYLAYLNSQQQVQNEQARSNQALQIAKMQIDAQMQQAIATGNVSQRKSLMDYQQAMAVGNQTGQYGLVKQDLANQGSMNVANLQYALPDITQMITGLKNQIGSLIKPQTAATPAPMVQAPPTQGSYPTGSASFGYSPVYDAQGQVSYSANPNPWAELDSSPDVQPLISEMFGWDANGQ